MLDAQDMIENLHPDLPFDFFLIKAKLKDNITNAMTKLYVRREFTQAHAGFHRGLFPCLSAPVLESGTPGVLNASGS